MKISQFRMKDDRLNRFQDWIVKRIDDVPESVSLVPVSDDASFRRYFRMLGDTQTRVFVDAPPEHEDNESFVKIATALLDNRIHCPEVLQADFEHGFLVVSDLGNKVYLEEMLNYPEVIEPLYQDAIETLCLMQSTTCELPAYDEAKLREEMSLFDDWFIKRQLGLELSREVRQMLDDLYRLLVDNALEQPQCFVHRDYHCRNLMVTDSNNPGVIDFQDAVMGPITYDLVSLYKDCYYRFERQVVVDAVHLMAGRKGTDPSIFLRWFDWMGVQRHLKCAGIFSRLNLRDGKPRYLNDIPLVLDYLQEVSDIYREHPEFERFGGWLRSEILPKVQVAPFKSGL